MEFSTAEDFHEVLNKVLYPARAISDIGHLKGRGKEQSLLSQSLLTQGRQPFIYGLRGAGKSSLALSTANEYSVEDNVLLTCAPQLRFGDIIRELVQAALKLDPLLTGETQSFSAEGGFNFGVGKVGGSGLETKSFGSVPAPNSPNQALALLEKALEARKYRFCFIVDEFDQLVCQDSHLQFGLLAKLIADSGSKVKFIFCGVADDVEQIFKAHPSTLRLFEPIEVNRLGLQACFDIIKDVEDQLDLKIERETQFRIAQISDGFPYFVHLILEKVLWRWFEDQQRSKQQTSPRHYEQGLLDASQSAALELKRPYELAAGKYALDGELIIWALANGNPLEKQIKQIHMEFCELYDKFGQNERPKNCLNQNQLSARLNHFMKESYGHMVKSPRRSHYAFVEKRMRGYARLRAELRGVVLTPDHPFMRNKATTIGDGEA